MRFYPELPMTIEIGKRKENTAMHKFSTHKAHTFS